MEDDRHLTSVRCYHSRCLLRAHEAYCPRPPRLWQASYCNSTWNEGWYIIVMSSFTGESSDRCNKQNCYLYRNWSNCNDFRVMPKTHREDHQARGSDSCCQPGWRNICAAQEINNFGHDVQVSYSNISLPPRCFVYGVYVAWSQLSRTHRPYMSRNCTQRPRHLPRRVEWLKKATRISWVVL